MSKAFGKSIFEKKKMKLNDDEKRGLLHLEEDFKNNEIGLHFELFTQKGSGKQAIAVVDSHKKLISANMMICGNNQRTVQVHETITFMLNERKKRGETFLDLAKEFKKELGL